MAKQPVVVTIKDDPLEIEQDIQKFLSALGYHGSYIPSLDRATGTATITVLLDTEQTPRLPRGRWETLCVFYPSGDRAALIMARLDGNTEAAAKIEAAMAEQESIDRENADAEASAQRYG